METQIYLVVGGKVKPAMARIVNGLAEVRTEYGIREFGNYHLSELDANKAISAKRNKARDELRAEFSANMDRMKATPARGSNGRAWHRHK